MAEDLTSYLQELNIRVNYLHSDIDTLERVQIIRALREGEFDVLVGINLLREGLDIPEVALVTILDADKEGFLRSARSLIQTCGRTARHVDGRVIMYADKITKSMQACLDETERRRTKQLAHNLEHGITPQSIKKSMRSILDELTRDSDVEMALVAEAAAEYRSPGELSKKIVELKQEMLSAAADLDFEKAAEIRDQMLLLEKHELALR